jgi:methionyl-tRNA formyltransferase
MKIGFFGDGLWATRTIALLRSNEATEIAFIGLRRNTEDHSLRTLALRYDIPIFIPADINEDKSIDFVHAHAPDLIVSMSYDQIFGTKFLTVFKKNVINCHAGALPNYRGRNVLNWAIINGEKYFGVTVHHVDVGIDTGPIISQVLCEISEADDYGTILLKAQELCPKLLYQVIIDYGNGYRGSIDQTGNGFYCRKRVFGDEFIDWTASTTQIANLIRGVTSPGPCATSFLNGVEYKFVKCLCVDDTANKKNYKPGQVVDLDCGNIYICTVDGVLIITDYKSAKAVPDIKIGDGFGGPY